jgi:hypothetical protein
MNRYLKIIFISLLSIVSFLALGSGVVSYFFKDEAIGFVIESINRQVTSRIEVKSAHFSVLRKFPNAAVEFRHVVMSPAKDFDTLDFDPVRSRHLLSAESVFAEMNFFRLLTGDYRITRMEVRDGNINMLELIVDIVRDVFFWTFDWRHWWFWLILLFLLLIVVAIIVAYCH